MSCLQDHAYWISDQNYVMSLIWLKFKSESLGLDIGDFWPASPPHGISGRGIKQEAMRPHPGSSGEDQEQRYERVDDAKAHDLSSPLCLGHWDWLGWNMRAGESWNRVTLSKPDTELRSGENREWRRYLLASAWCSHSAECSHNKMSPWPVTRYMHRILHLMTSLLDKRRNYDYDIKI